MTKITTQCSVIHFLIFHNNTTSKFQRISITINSCNIYNCTMSTIFINNREQAYYISSCATSYRQYINAGSFLDCRFAPQNDNGYAFALLHMCILPHLRITTNGNYHNTILPLRFEDKKHILNMSIDIFANFEVYYKTT